MKLYVDIIYADHTYTATVRSPNQLEEYLNREPRFFRIGEVRTVELELPEYSAREAVKRLCERFSRVREDPPTVYHHMDYDEGLMRRPRKEYHYRVKTVYGYQFFDAHNLSEVKNALSTVFDITGREIIEITRM